MPDSTRFNPAQRLFEIVIELQRQERKWPLWQSYNKVLGYGNSQSDALFFAFELADLANTVERDIKSNQSINKELLPQLKPLLDLCHELNLRRSTADYCNGITPEAMTALKAYSIFFKSIYSEEKISEDQYKNITESLQELINKVSEIDDLELRQLASSILESARKCISLYKINGSRPFSDSFDLAIGKLVIFYKKNEHADRPIIVTNILSFVSKLKEIADTTNALLALPSGVADAIKSIGL